MSIACPTCTGSNILISQCEMPQGKLLQCWCKTCNAGWSLREDEAFAAPEPKEPVEETTDEED